MYVQPGSTCLHRHPSAQTQEVLETHQLHFSNGGAARKFFIFFYLPGVSRHTFFLKQWNAMFVGGIKLPYSRDRERDKLILCLFSSPLHLGLKSQKKFIFSHHKILLIVHWLIMPLSNINLPATLFSPGYFLPHHTNLGRGAFWSELIFLYDVSDHIDLSLHLVSTSVH